MRDFLKSVVLVFIAMSFSLFVIGYVETFFLFRPVAALVHSLGFGPKTVGEFLAGWFILALPNILCGAIMGMYVPLYRQLILSPAVIALLFFGAARMYLWSKSLIWVCDSWNLLFLTAMAGFVVGIVKRSGIQEGKGKPIGYGDE